MIEPVDVVRGMLEEFGAVREAEGRGVWEVEPDERPELARRLLGQVFERWTVPDVEYREDPSWPGAATYTGHEAVTAIFADYAVVLGLEPPDILEVVEGREGVAVAVRVDATSPDSAEPVPHTWGYLFRVQGERVSAFWAYVDSDEAFAAAGIERGSA